MMFPSRTGVLFYLATSKSSVVPHRTIVSNPNGRPLLFSLINDGGQFRPQKVSNPNGRPLLFSREYCQGKNLHGKVSNPNGRPLLFSRSHLVSSMEVLWSFQPERATSAI